MGDKMEHTKKKVVATIEARMTSSRLPGKVLMEYCNISNLEHIVARLRRSKYIDEVVVATTVNDTDMPVVELCEKIGCQYYRGSEDDVLVRVLEAAKSVEADIIVEITGDCPVIDWRHIDYLIEKYLESNYDYISNTIERTFPRGFDTQVFSVSVLEKVKELTKSPVDREHVSLYIYTNPDKFKLCNWEAEGLMKHPELGITLDNNDDYELIKDIYERLYWKDNDFSAEDVVNLLLSDKSLYSRAQDRHRKDPLIEQKEWEVRHGEI